MTLTLKFEKGINTIEQMREEGVPNGGQTLTNNQASPFRLGAAASLTLKGWVLDNLVASDLRCVLSIPSLFYLQLVEKFFKIG